MRITKTNLETFPPNEKKLVEPELGAKSEDSAGRAGCCWRHLGEKDDWKQKINRTEQKSGTEKMGSKKQWWLCQMWLATPVKKIIGNKRKL